MDNKFLEWILHIIDSLPTVEGLNVPQGVYIGIGKMTALLGYFMPFDLYRPLFTFILAFTAFRITYSIYMRIKK